MHIQLQRAKSNDYLFIVDRPRKRGLSFHFDFVRWIPHDKDPSRDRNKTVRTQTIDAAHFSAEWNKLAGEGWRVCG